MARLRTAGGRGERASRAPPGQESRATVGATLDRTKDGGRRQMRVIGQEREM